MSVNPVKAKDPEGEGTIASRLVVENTVEFPVLYNLAERISEGTVVPVVLKYISVSNPTVQPDAFNGILNT